ncbi:hypothetical protein NL676_026096 [Syzygium grande]|nr:hypothetical protein NL676_026096 [Syzygium grande]
MAASGEINNAASSSSGVWQLGARRLRLVESRGGGARLLVVVARCSSGARNKNSSSTTRKNRQGLELYSYFRRREDPAARLVTVGAADVGKQQAGLRASRAACGNASLERGHKSYKGREFGHEGLGRAHALFSRFSFCVRRVIRFFKGPSPARLCPRTPFYR